MGRPRVVEPDLWSLDVGLWQLPFFPRRRALLRSGERSLLGAAPLAPLEVEVEAAIRDLDAAVFLEAEDPRRDLSQEDAVVADDEDDAREGDERVLERAERRQVEVVRRLV